MLTKKFISMLLSLAFVSSLSTNVYAMSEKNNVANDSILQTNIVTTDENNNETRATGLIQSYSLSVRKEDTSLVLSATTTCTSEIVKCGFKSLVIQRKASDSDIWEDYIDYGELYVDTFVYNVSLTAGISSGYSYRAVGVHYAKKSFLSTQKIENTSNIV